jgi:methylated-DNA-[protein]-cysteine S-methyltransferase
MRSASYYLQPSPIGELLIGVSEEGICLVHWGDPDHALALLEESYASVERTTHVASVGCQLDEYFDGQRRLFTLPLDLSLTTPFGKRVLGELAKVPFGDLITYGELARRVGSYPRAVGGAVGRNPIPVVVPCHRVVAVNGIGGFGGGLRRKRILLGLEGHSRDPLLSSRMQLAH